MDYFGAPFQIYCYQSRSPRWKTYFQPCKLSVCIHVSMKLWIKALEAEHLNQNKALWLFWNRWNHMILHEHTYESTCRSPEFLRSIVKITNKKDCSSTEQKSGTLLGFCQDFSHFLCLLVMWASHCFIKQAVRGILFSLADFYHSSYCQTWQTGSWRYELGIVGKNLDG